MKLSRAFYLIFVLWAAGLAFDASALPSYSTPWNTSFELNPAIKYTKTSIFGQGSVPSYEGLAYGAEVQYMIGTPGFSMGPFFQMVTTSLDNSANNSDQQERLTGTFATLGIKLYTEYTYLKLGTSQLRLTDRATGNVENTKKLKSDGIEIGAGVNYYITDKIAFNPGLDIGYYKISPANNDIQGRLDYMSYSFVLSFRFIIPSGTSGDR